MEGSGDKINKASEILIGTQQTSKLLFFLIVSEAVIVIVVLNVPASAKQLKSGSTDNFQQLPTGYIFLF